MKNMDINKLKRPVKYGKIPLKLLHNKGDHIFTGLKAQLEITDTLIDNILPQDNELIKLKKVLNWEKINNIYKECFPSKTGGIDKRELSKGKKEIDDQVKIVKELIKDGGYFVQPDHHIPKDIPYDNLAYFINEVNKLGAYPEFRREIT